MACDDVVRLGTLNAPRTPRPAKYANFLAEMRFFHALRTSVLAAACCVCAHGQGTPSKDAATEVKGLPPRTTPADYLAQAKAGKVTIAAEFKGHAVPTADATLTSEEYVVVEVGLYGAPGEHLTLTFSDFSLRINGKKEALSSEPYGLVLSSLKDPEWQPPEKSSSKPKTSFGGSGRGDEAEPTTPVKIPIELQRAMAKRTQKATLAEGDRPLPQAGLLYFPYRGKTQKIRSVELIYKGPAGEAAFELQP